MEKVYFIRHQAAGFLHDHPFASEPTDAQKAPLLARCVARHGAVHQKTGEPHWHRVESFDVLAAGQVPELPEVATGPQEMPGPTASGVGTVTPRSK